jgi:hypothetical protein
VGTAAGGTQIFRQNMKAARSVTVSTIPTSGSIYVRLWSKIGTQWVYNDYTYTGGGEKAILTAPTPGSALSGSTVTFSWTAGSGATEYHLDVGTAAGGTQIFRQNMKAARSVTVSTIPTSGTIYVRLWSRINRTWVYNDYTYTGGRVLWDTARWDQVMWEP